MSINVKLITNTSVDFVQKLFPRNILLEKNSVIFILALFIAIFEIEIMMDIFFVYIGAKAISVPDGFIENPILCSH